MNAALFKYFCLLLLQKLYFYITNLYMLTTSNVVAIVVFSIAALGVAGLCLLYRYRAKNKRSRYDLL